MKKETVRTLMIVVGVLVLLAIAGLGSAVWLFTRAIDVATADATSAERSFEEIRQRFGGVSPILEIRDGETLLTRQPPAQPTSGQLTTLRVMAWDMDDERFTRVDLPFWLLRLKSGPVSFGHRREMFGNHHVNLTVEQLERYGPTLVLDHSPRGRDHVIVWTE